MVPYDAGDHFWANFSIVICYYYEDSGCKKVVEGVWCVLP